MNHLSEKKASDNDFLDFINYADYKTIKSLLEYYIVLEDKIAKGNTLWGSIKCDLDKAIENINLTDKQRFCINCFMYKNKLKDISLELNCSYIKVGRYIITAIKEISKYLSSKQE